MSPPLLVFLSPALLLFELAQLVLAERYLGVRQIERAEDPREAPVPAPLAAVWSAAIVVNWLWMLVMLPLRFGAGQVACMLLTSLIGYSLRRNCALKWVLVILTFEGAIRIGMHVSVLTLVWRSV
jgi:hypothetical protein